MSSSGTRLPAADRRFVENRRDLSLSDLPNEILLTILYPFPTPQLLPLTSLSHRFAHLVLRIVHGRLLASSQLGGARSLQLECYHPSLRLTAEALLCAPLGIDGLEPPDSGKSPIDQLRQYNDTFTRFRPFRKDTKRVRPRRHPAGDVPGTRTYEARSSSSPAQPTPPTPQEEQPPASSAATSSTTPFQRSETEQEEEFYAPVTQTVNLDTHEMFTQLQTTTSLVTAGPKTGFVYSAVTASEGVVRVFRDWLQEQDAKRAHRERPERLGKGTERVIRRSKDGLAYVNPPVSPLAEDEKVDVNDSSYLWVNDNATPNVGVRFTVTEKKWKRNAPVIMRADEEAAVSYDVQIEEVVVRARHLLVVTEQGLRERNNAMGNKAIIIGSW
ncbi:MAG: hypothetical protein Q9159_007506 [Coniocarpon cinnabarinum]